MTLPQQREQIVGIILMIKILVSVLLCANMSFASCPKPVQPIKKGSIANCDGFLFSDKTEKKASVAVEDSKYYKNLSDKLDLRVKASLDREDVVNKRLNLYIKQSETLAEKIERKERFEIIKNVLYFSLGATLTAIIASNVK